MIGANLADIPRHEMSLGMEKKIYPGQIRFSGRHRKLLSRLHLSNARNPAERFRGAAPICDITELQHATSKLHINTSNSKELIACWATEYKFGLF
jgi:hypothetical protein